MNEYDYQIRVITEDGIFQESRIARTMDEAYRTFDELVSIYSADGGYNVQMSDYSGTVHAQEFLPTVNHDGLCYCEKCQQVSY